MDASQARSFYEECLATIYVRRQMERMTDYYASDVISHPDIPGLPAGVAGLERVTQGFLGSFSGLSVHFDEFTQEGGDTFRCLLRAEATHSGEFMGIAATGRRVVIVAEHRLRFHAGRIAECWNQVDPALVQKQLSGAGSHAA